MSGDPCRCAVCAVLRARATPTRRTTPLPMDAATYAWRVAFGQRLMAAGVRYRRRRSAGLCVFRAGYRLVAEAIAASSGEPS